MHKRDYLLIIFHNKYFINNYKTIKIHSPYQFSTKIIPCGSDHKCYSRWGKTRRERTWNKKTKGKWKI